MRVALALVVLVPTLSACHDGAGRSAGVDVHPDSVYTFTPGAFEPDRVPGLARLDAAAERGDPDAQYQVALLRHWMTGDHAAALPVFRRLADEGHPAATGTLAAAYMHGQGVAADPDEAGRWLGRAAALGDEHAARDLAAYRARRPAPPSR